MIVFSDIPYRTNEVYIFFEKGSSEFSMSAFLSFCFFHLHMLLTIPSMDRIYSI